VAAVAIARVASTSESAAVAEAPTGAQVLIRRPPPQSYPAILGKSMSPPLVGSLRAVGASKRKASMSG